MDYCNDNEEHWAWKGNERRLQEDSICNESQYTWNEMNLDKKVTLNEEDLSYMYDETTPVKACGDLAYHVSQNDTMNKELEERKGTSSQVKRRRMLQFDTQMEDSIICNEEISNMLLESNETVNSLDEVLPQASEWLSGFPDVSASSYEGLDHSSERWLAECFNDSEMHFSDDMNFSGVSDFQIDISDFCKDPPDSDACLVPKRVPCTPRNVVFKGTKSFIRTPTKLASSIAYPFAFVKPCGFHGDVTLKDINQKIRTPPPSKSKQTEEDPSAYPTSAFSGKPVVGKTKIRTEGGKGSITIMRTKG